MTYSTSKIFIVTDQYDKITSGPGRFVQYLRESIGDNNYQFVFVSIEKSNNLKKLNIIREKEDYIKIYIPDNITSIFYKLYINKKLFSYLDEQYKNFNILYVTSSLAGTFLLRKDNVFLMFNDFYNLMIFENIVKNLKKFGLKKILSRVILFLIEYIQLKKNENIIVNSKYFQQILLCKYNKKSHLLYKGVDLDFFKNSIKKNYYKPRNILFVKNNWRVGGLLELLETLDELEWSKELNVVAAGLPQEDINYLYKNFKELKLNLVLYPTINIDQLRTFINESDLYINFSENEALGVCLMENIASGNPVIAVDSGGVNEVLNGGSCGILINVRQKLKAVLYDLEYNTQNDQFENMVTSGYEHIKMFDKKKLIPNLLRIVCGD